MNSIQKVKKNESGICYITGFRRYISILLDLIIIFLFLHMFSLAFNHLFINLSEIIIKYQIQILSSAEDREIQSKLIKLMIINQIVQFIILFHYVVYMWIRFGATLGKLLLGLRVVDQKTFKKITLKQAIKRFFSLILSVTPLFLGFIWSNFDQHCQTWHDKIAGTAVVTSKSLRKQNKKNT